MVRVCSKIIERKLEILKTQVGREQKKKGGRKVVDNQMTRRWIDFGQMIFGYTISQLKPSWLLCQISLVHHFPLPKTDNRGTWVNITNSSTTCRATASHVRWRWAVSNPAFEADLLHARWRPYMNRCFIIVRFLQEERFNVYRNARFAAWRWDINSNAVEQWNGLLENLGCR